LPGQWYSVKLVIDLVGIALIGFFMRRAYFCAK
jgi:hypothetical protein